MSALARYFRKKGLSVSGYDKTRTALTGQLEKEGIAIHYTEDMGKIPKTIMDPGNKDKMLVVFTPAIPPSHKELVYFRDNGYRLIKRSQLLGELSRNHYTIAVAGTHGKTTVSTLIAHLMKCAEKSFTAFLGGISTNYETNLLENKSGELIVAEADEYDKSFLTLYPNIGIITSMDPDHLDIYGSLSAMENTYIEFAGQIKNGGTLIINKKLVNKIPLKLKKNLKIISYSITEEADYRACSINIHGGKYVFDIETPAGVWNEVLLGHAGRHNIENSLAAIATCSELGIREAVIRNGLEFFRGVKRRFEIIYQSETRVYIDDYAHHPEELRACISSVKEMYPGKKVLGVFQPHLYSRTKDFCDGFAKSLSMLDEVILLDIYPAREEPIQGVDSSLILNRITSKKKRISSKENLPALLYRSDADVILTLGAGDIDKLVEPIRKKLNGISKN